MSGDKSGSGGQDASRNGINGGQNGAKGSKTNKDKDGDDEMTVVVPPLRSSNSPTAPDKATVADLTNGNLDGNTSKGEAQMDPKEKAISGKRTNL
jgi:26S proteasome regulatory subunit N3